MPLVSNSPIGSYAKATGQQPPAYASGYAHSGSDEVGSGSSRLTVPGEDAFSGSGRLHDAGDALDACAQVLVQQTKLYAEAEASEAIGDGLDHLRKLHNVYSYTIRL